MYKNKQLITGVILISKLIKRLTKQDNVGLLLPSSPASFMSNMATLCCAKTVVNLNYSTTADIMDKCIQKADIDLILCSKVFITRLKAKGFDFFFIT